MVAIVTLMARSSLADHYHVPSGSMLPTVAIDDRVIVDKIEYGVRLPFSQHWLTPIELPARGDVVVLESPEDGRVLLKRVVAVAGDRVTVRSGRLVLDGRAIEEPHVRLSRAGGPDFGPVVVPEGSLLVMGDNRGESHDGRSFGFVRDEALLGAAVAIYWHDGSPTWRALR